MHRARRRYDGEDRVLIPIRTNTVKQQFDCHICSHQKIKRREPRHPAEQRARSQMPVGDGGLCVRVGFVHVSATQHPCRSIRSLATHQPHFLSCPPPTTRAERTVLFGGIGPRNALVVFVDQNPAHIPLTATKDDVRTLLSLQIVVLAKRSDVSMRSDVSRSRRLVFSCENSGTRSFSPSLTSSGQHVLVPHPVVPYGRALSFAAAYCHFVQERSTEFHGSLSSHTAFLTIQHIISYDCWGRGEPE